VLFEKDAETMRFFHPHPFDPTVARRICEANGRDVWLGAFDGERMIGYAMLRGWDEGHEVPSFGIAVAREHQGQGAGRALFAATVDIVRQQGGGKMMLKVHPENRLARAWYRRLGFQEAGLADDGEEIYRLLVPEA